MHINQMVSPIYSNCIIFLNLKIYTTNSRTSSLRIVEWGILKLVDSLPKITSYRNKQKSIATRTWLLQAARRVHLSLNRVRPLHLQVEFGSSWVGLIYWYVSRDRSWYRGNGEGRCLHSIHDPGRWGGSFVPIHAERERLAWKKKYGVQVKLIIWNSAIQI